MHRTEYLEADFKRMHYWNQLNAIFLIMKIKLSGLQIFYLRMDRI